jgi:SP family arabinose:H+ symporter-like MFS transporter
LLNHSDCALAKTDPTKKGYLYVISLVAATGGFLFGYDLDILTGAQIFLKRDFQLTPWQLGLVVSSATIGCILGPILGGPLADWIGRKKTLTLTALVFGVGVVGTIVPSTAIEFEIFRFVGGIGVGLACVVSPMYISEIAPADMRGRLVTLNQVAIVLGSLLAMVVAYFFSFSGNWRAMFASELVPVCLFTVGLAFIPESPRWLHSKNRVSQARDVLLQLISPAAAELELGEISDSLQEKDARLSELLRPGLRRGLFIAITLAILQQFTGVSPIGFYMPIMFQDAGFVNASEAILQAIIVAIWTAVWTLVAMWYIDRLGRRPLLLIGTIGMCVGLLVMGVFFQLKLSGAYVVIMMMISMAFYSISLAPLAWLIMAEIFPTRFRGTAMAVASVFLWLATFLSTQTLPALNAFAQRKFGSTASIFWLFSAICLGAFAFSWKFVPETKGRSLEEIGRSWTAEAK